MSSSIRDEINAMPWDDLIDPDAVTPSAQEQLLARNAYLALKIAEARKEATELRQRAESAEE